MLDHTALSPEAMAYFRTLPLSAQIALEHSNLTFRTLEDLKSYRAQSVGNLNSVLYQRLPEPDVPSNATLDPLDSESGPPAAHQ